MSSLNRKAQPARAAVAISSPSQKLCLPRSTPSRAALNASASAATVAKIASRSLICAGGGATGDDPFARCRVKELCQGLKGEDAVSARGEDQDLKRPRVPQARAAIGGIDQNIAVEREPLSRHKARRG
jgi:hypothetical protein